MTATKSTAGKQALAADLQTLFSELTLPLMKYPEDLVFTIDHLGQYTIVNVRQVHADDYGQIVGTAGNTIRAVKVLVTSLAQKHGRNSNYMVARNLIGEEGERAKFKADPDFDAEPLRALLGRVLVLFFSAVTVSAVSKFDATVLNARVSSAEPMLDCAHEISDALGTIFRAIGKAQGRNEVFVELKHEAQRARGPEDVR